MPSYVRFDCQGAILPYLINYAWAISRPWGHHSKFQITHFVPHSLQICYLNFQRFLVFTSSDTFDRQRLSWKVILRKSPLYVFKRLFLLFLRLYVRKSDGVWNIMDKFSFPPYKSQLNVNKKRIKCDDIFHPMTEEKFTITSLLRENFDWNMEFHIKSLIDFCILHHLIVT